LVEGEPKKTREKAEKAAKGVVFMRRGWGHGGEKKESSAPSAGAGCIKGGAARATATVGPTRARKKK
jgi:hypothetical protein